VTCRGSERRDGNRHTSHVRLCGSGRVRSARLSDKSGRTQLSLCGGTTRLRRPFRRSVGAPPLAGAFY